MERKRRKKRTDGVRLEFLNGELSQMNVYCVKVIYSYTGRALLGGTQCGGIMWVKAVRYRSVQQYEIGFEHI